MHNCFETVSNPAISHPLRTIRLELGYTSVIEIYCKSLTVILHSASAKQKNERSDRGDFAIYLIEEVQDTTCTKTLLTLILKKFKLTGT